VEEAQFCQFKKKKGSHKHAHTPLQKCFLWAEIMPSEKYDFNLHKGFFQRKSRPNSPDFEKK
jgi:hypothetical protein